MPYLWQIALWSRNKIIVEESINMLRDIHTSLVENLQRYLITIRGYSIDKCMKHLICALDIGESWKSIEDVNARKCVSKMDQVERCLRLLRIDFIISRLSGI